MGIIEGFVCSNCNYEKTYMLGTGMRFRKEKRLYECSVCQSLKASVLPNPKCSKCNKETLSEIKDYDKDFKCPKCNLDLYKNQICGNWD